MGEQYDNVTGRVVPPQLEVARLDRIFKSLPENVVRTSVLRVETRDSIAPFIRANGNPDTENIAQDTDFTVEMANVLLTNEQRTLMNVNRPTPDPMKLKVAARHWARCSNNAVVIYDVNTTNALIDSARANAPYAGPELTGSQPLIAFELFRNSRTTYIVWQSFPSDPSRTAIVWHIDSCRTADADTQPIGHSIYKLLRNFAKQFVASCRHADIRHDVANVCRVLFRPVTFGPCAVAENAPLDTRMVLNIVALRCLVQKQAYAFTADLARRCGVLLILDVLGLDDTNPVVMTGIFRAPRNEELLEFVDEFHTAVAHPDTLTSRPWASWSVWTIGSNHSPAQQVQDFVDDNDDNLSGNSDDNGGDDDDDGNETQSDHSLHINLSVPSSTADEQPGVNNTDPPPGNNILGQLFNDAVNDGDLSAALVVDDHLAQQQAAGQSLPEPENNTRRSPSPARRSSPTKHPSPSRRKPPTSPQKDNKSATPPKIATKTTPPKPSRDPSPSNPPQPLQPTCSVTSETITPPPRGPQPSMMSTGKPVPNASQLQIPQMSFMQEQINTLTRNMAQFSATVAQREQRTDQLLSMMTNFIAAQNTAPAAATGNQNVSVPIRHGHNVHQFNQQQTDVSNFAQRAATGLSSQTITLRPAPAATVPSAATSAAATSATQTAPSSSEMPDPADDPVRTTAERRKLKQQLSAPQSQNTPPPQRVPPKPTTLPPRPKPAPKIVTFQESSSASSGDTESEEEDDDEEEEEKSDDPVEVTPRPSSSKLKPTSSSRQPVPRKQKPFRAYGRDEEYVPSPSSSTKRTGTKRGAGKKKKKYLFHPFELANRNVNVRIRSNIGTVDRDNTDNNMNRIATWTDFMAVVDRNVPSLYRRRYLRHAAASYRNYQSEISRRHKQSTRKAKDNNGAVAYCAWCRTWYCNAERHRNLTTNLHVTESHMEPMALIMGMFVFRMQDDDEDEITDRVGRFSDLLRLIVAYRAQHPPADIEVGYSQEGESSAAIWAHMLTATDPETRGYTDSNENREMPPFYRTSKYLRVHGDGTPYQEGDSGEEDEDDDEEFFLPSQAKKKRDDDYKGPPPPGGGTAPFRPATTSSSRKSSPAASKQQNKQQQPQHRQKVKSSGRPLASPTFAQLLEQADRNAELHRPVAKRVVPPIKTRTPLRSPKPKTPTRSPSPRPLTPTKVPVQRLTPMKTIPETCAPAIEPSKHAVRMNYTQKSPIKQTHSLTGRAMKRYPGPPARPSPIRRPPPPPAHVMLRPVEQSAFRHIATVQRRLPMDDEEPIF